MKLKCCYCRRLYDNGEKPRPREPEAGQSTGVCRDCTPRANAEVDAVLKGIAEFHKDIFGGRKP